VPSTPILRVSLFAVYRMCNEKRRNFFQRFSTGFDVLTTNTSPLDPVVLRASVTTADTVSDRAATSIDTVPCLDLDVAWLAGSATLL